MFLKQQQHFFMLDAFKVTINNNQNFGSKFESLLMSCMFNILKALVVIAWNYFIQLLEIYLICLIL